MTCQATYALDTRHVKVEVGLGNEAFGKITHDYPLLYHVSIINYDVWCELSSIAPNIEMLETYMEYQTSQKPIIYHPREVLLLFWIGDLLFISNIYYIDVLQSRYLC